MSATAFAASGLHRSSLSGGALRLLDSAESDIPLFQSLGVTRAVNHDMVVTTGAQHLYLIKYSLGEVLHVFRHEGGGVILNDSASVCAEADETIVHVYLLSFHLRGTLPLREHVTPMGKCKLQKM